VVQDYVPHRALVPPFWLEWSTGLYGVKDMVHSVLWVRGAVLRVPASWYAKWLVREMGHNQTLGKNGKDIQRGLRIRLANASLPQVLLQSLLVVKGSIAGFTVEGRSMRR